MTNQRQQILHPMPVAILHPSASFRHGLGATLDGELFAVEEPDDLQAWLAVAERRAIVVGDGTEATVISMRLPEIAVIVLVTTLEAGKYRRALAAGADGVAHVDAHPDTIAQVVKAAIIGEVVLPAEVARQLAGRAQPAELELSSEELGLLQRLSDGATVVQLADEFYLAERSVRRRLQNVYLRLGATGRAEALKRASQLGLVA